MTRFDFSLLTRAPDVEAPNLQAHDAADRLLLDSSAARLSPDPNGIVTIGDRYGALTLGAISRFGARDLRVHQDALSQQRALAVNAARFGLQQDYSSHGLGPELLQGARTVLLQLPRSLDALDEMACAIVSFAGNEVVVFAGGRVKHMSVSMNGVLERYFGTVTAGLARQKARVICASSPLGSLPSRFPVTASHDVGLGRELELYAYGSTFGAAALDAGTRFLLPFLAQARPADEAIDLGCGNGAIAAYLALLRPSLRVIATDQSSSAVASALRTVQANGVSGRVHVVRDDALSARPDGSAQLIVLNPPFHIGGTIHTGIARKLFADAGRVLAPGGELWTVWNSHLQYRQALASLVGPTRQVARSPRFTVTCSTRDR
ncbi:class I SAM-dependent methyltransferase [Arthrobacter sp. Br18]|uniref:class I SAM-dependent methyltransferase n=1 Tax=Arthrobacter sp. Br18 TaxID=1312954 RepID=UPI00047C9016|nr:class I SAM-dependent methyltransferase [Arthrobacter sp. Br18]